MGRKKKPADEHQGEPVSVRFQAEVMEAIRRACAVTQIPPSVFIRAAVLERLYQGGYWRPKPDKEPGKS